MASQMICADDAMQL